MLRLPTVLLLAWTLAHPAAAPAQTALGRSQMAHGAALRPVGHAASKPAVDSVCPCARRGLERDVLAGATAGAILTSGLVAIYIMANHVEVGSVNWPVIGGFVLRGAAAGAVAGLVFGSLDRALAGG